MAHSLHPKISSYTGLCVDNDATGRLVLQRHG
jgi:hypothetical protein